MHWIQALIAHERVLLDARDQLACSVVCPLTQGFALIPITDEVEAYLRLSASGADASTLPPSGEIAEGLAAFARALSKHGPVVYVATFIHGGTGGQDALAWIDGELVLRLGDGEENMSAWPNSPISRALRHVGVRAGENEDEFDALGLGRHRSNEGWAKHHS